MKFRLTPLNIVTSLGLVLWAMSYFQTKQTGTLDQFDMSPLYKIILGSLVLISIVTDLIFRFLFKELKRIWLVELVFISLTVIIFLLLQK